MKNNIFDVSVFGVQYKMVLPGWEYDHIQKIIADSGKPYEKAMLEDMIKELREDDLVLDVGANVGNHSIFLAAVKGCSLMAFEPNPELFEPLKRTIELNGLCDKIELFPFGVGGKVGKASFTNLNPKNLGAQSLEMSDNDSAEVQVITLDSIEIKRPVSIIKIDVEGMEVSVLKGARELIVRDRPTLYIEAQSENDFLDLKVFLSELGYVYWATFNATPTHCFKHSSRLDLNMMGTRSFQFGLETYKAHKLKHELISRKSDFKNRLDVIGLAVGQMLIDSKNLNSHLEGLNEALKNDMDIHESIKETGKSYSIAAHQSVQPLQFDFSLPEDACGIDDLLNEGNS